MQIMVDRGFKKIESMILAKGCEILRPPSVSNSKQLSKASKRAASKRASDHW